MAVASVVLRRMAGQENADFVLVDHADEPLPIRSVEIGPTVTIVHEKLPVAETIVDGVLFEDGFLVTYAVGIAREFIVPRKAAV